MDDASAAVVVDDVAYHAADNNNSDYTDQDTDLGVVAADAGLDDDQDAHEDEQGS